MCGCVIAGLLAVGTARAEYGDGSIVGWGEYVFGGDLSQDIVAVAASSYHSLAVKSDGSIVAWGSNTSGRCAVPEPNADFVAAGAGVSHSLGLKSDGSIVAWGDNEFGNCDVPAPNSDFVAVAGGYYHSLGLKSDGSIVAWGWNGLGQCDVPAPNADFVAATAGKNHSLGVKSDGSVVAWGSNFDGQCDVPAPNADFVAIAGGDDHSLGLKSDGSIVAWGGNDYGQCDVPAPNSDFVAVAAGLVHSLGLKADGSIVAWGSNFWGQCDVPAPNTDFVAIAGGGSQSLGLKSDGSVVAWGSNYDYAPEPNADFVTVAAGSYHRLAVKSDGSIVAWGGNHYGQCDVPAPNTDFVAASGGRYHSLGLKSDGSIVAWGLNDDGQCDVPAPNTDFVAVAGGWYHSLGLKSDGSVVAWGLNDDVQCDVPAPNTDFVAIDCGGRHSLGLKSDGSIVAWGRNFIGQCDVPAPNSDFVAVAGGGHRSLGLKSDGSVVVWGKDPSVPTPNTNFTAVAVGDEHYLGLKVDGSVVAWGSNDYYQCNVPWPNADFVAIAAGETHSLGLVVTIGPTITQQPVSQSVCEGDPVTFTVTATGTGTLTYQWRKDTVAIGGATSDSYTIDPVAAGDAGNYDVVVTDDDGSTTSNTATLTVNTGPTITVQPSSQSVCEGDPVTFTVTATGTGTLTYQWRKDTVDIGGATSDSYTIDPVSPADAGDYDVVVTDDCGSLTSDTATLTVNTGPTITGQPVSQDVCEGDPVTFTVTATGTGTLTYQWRKDSVDIGGATSDSYTIDPAAPSDAGNYDVVVTDDCGSLTSDTATLTVNTGPTITMQPSSQSVCEGDPVMFTVTASGTGTLTYQWRKDSVDIGGATSDSYTIDPVAAGDAGDYDVVVTDDCGSVTSDTATLTVNTGTTITMQPSSQSVCEGDPVMFTVTASGTGTLTYQWRKDSVDIGGATSDSYTIDPVSPADAGGYDVVVTDDCGSVTSDTAALTVNTGPTITVQPVSQDVCEGDPVTFTVTATGTGTLTYQWRKDTVDIGGATSDSYTIDPVTAGDAGDYDVVVTDDCGSVTSDTATLTVNTEPTITVQPVSQSVCEGDPVTFTVTATGTGTLSYQWRKDTVDIGGATSDSYTIDPVAAGDAGDYDVVVTNDCGSVTSDTATLTVNVCGPVIYVDADAPLGGDGETWNTAYRHLQDALYTAVSGDEIRVGAGVYKPDEDEAGNVTPGERNETFQLASGVELYGGYAGYGAPDPDERNVTAYQTTLSGDLTGNDAPDFVNYDENSYHVLTGVGAGETAVLDGFTVRAGNANGGGEQDQGGGLRSPGGVLSVYNTQFTDNYASGDGGGMYHADGALTVVDCEFTDNESGLAGGGLWKGAGTGALEGCFFSGNEAGSDGGGMCNDGGANGSMSYVGCVFSANSSQRGGGLRNSDGNDSFVLVNCTFTGNSSSAEGGGLLATGGPLLVNCLFTGNNANWGGGTYFSRDYPTIANCTFTGNTASTIGGGTYNWKCSPVYDNCIFYGNSAPDGPQLAERRDTLTVRFSDVQGGQAGIYLIDGATVTYGPGNIDADPSFVDPDGPDDDPNTWDDNDYRLGGGSPCIDAADNTAVPADQFDLDGDSDFGEPIPFDLDGSWRFVDDPGTTDTGNGTPPIVDMGAYEYSP